MSQATVAALHVVDDKPLVRELPELPIEDLVIGDDFRLDEDLEDLNELAASIKELGVLQPLDVRPLGPLPTSGWQVVAGRRRLAAARIAGLTTVPCIVEALDDERALDKALAENLHRRQLSPIEEALAYARLRSEKGLNQTQIAARVGRSQTHVSMLLRLLEFPPDVQQMIHQGKLSYATVLAAPSRYGSDRKKRVRKKSDSRPQYGVHSLDSLSQLSVQASHWRRRHDRVMSWLHLLHNNRLGSVDEYHRTIDRMIHLDAQPFEENSSAQAAT